MAVYIETLSNFDDERFIDMQASDLNTVLESLYVVYGNFKRLFVNEIQNAHGWHLWINRLLRQRIKTVVTGSNAKLLSGKLASTSLSATTRYGRALLPECFSLEPYFKHPAIGRRNIRPAPELKPFRQLRRQQQHRRLRPVLHAKPHQLPAFHFHVQLGAPAHR